MRYMRAGFRLRPWRPISSTIYRLAAQLGVTVKGSIYTHFHIDHCGGEAGPDLVGMVGRAVLPGAREVQERGGLIWAGAADAARIRKQCSVESVISLSDGDVLDCGDLVLHVLHTPGYSPLGSFGTQGIQRRGALGWGALGEGALGTQGIHRTRVPKETLAAPPPSLKGFH